MTQTGLARLLGVTGRTMRNWLARTYPVPMAVVMLTELVDETSRRTGKTPRQVLERLGRICAVKEAGVGTDGPGMAEEGGVGVR